MKNYQPGSHIIATLESGSNSKLESYHPFKDFIESLVQLHQLQTLGTVYHNFNPGGFTAVLCLSESHISIHTWPEYNKVNLDIYLSNYLKENDGTVDTIFEAMKTFFDASVIQQHKLIR